MSSLACKNCGSSEVESDSSRGDVVCTKCGSVLEDNLIISEVQFEEGTRGASHVVGQMVSSESGFKGLSVGTIIGNGKESRQITLDNAKRKIRSVGSQLRLNNHCIDTAFNFYKMALSRRLTHGRKNAHVIAACIYITCRIEGTSHMLLDLSDVSQVNVYDLGRTYLRLSSALCINIPAIDPCLYIVRFANRLNLGNKTHEVEMTALRLVQRMKRDWMHTGRRPSGLCGAALLVAARLNDIHCSIKDVIKVVKVCETTIRKRLTEFGETPSSKLTLEEFMTVDLEDEEDPPCYKATRKKVKHTPEEGQKMEEIEEQIAELQKQIDKDLEKSRKKLKGPWTKFATTSEVDKDCDESNLTETFIVSETVNTVCDIIKDDSQIERESFIQQMKDLRPTAAQLNLTESFGLIDGEESNIEESFVDTAIVQNPETEENFVCEESGELDMTDINDEEINSYLLTPSEIVAKTQLWSKIHADYLRDVAEKEKRKQEEEAERREKEAQGEIQPKKKRRAKKRLQIQANNAGEAIEKMLQEKRISNKINYEVLKKLSGNFSTSSDVVENPEESEANSSLRRLPSMRNMLNISSQNLRTSLFAKAKQNKPLLGASNIEIDKADDVDEPSSSTLVPAVSESINNFMEDEEPYDEGDAGDDYNDFENENAEHHLSIAELMRGQRGEDEMVMDYDYDEDYE